MIMNWRSSGRAIFRAYSYPNTYDIPLHLETPVPEYDQVILRPQHLKTLVLDYDLEILRPKRAISKSEVYVA